jgi:hypothetical protein
LLIFLVSKSRSASSTHRHPDLGEDTRGDKRPSRQFIIIISGAFNFELVVDLGIRDIKGLNFS